MRAVRPCEGEWWATAAQGFDAGIEGALLPRLGGGEVVGGDGGPAHGALVDDAGAALADRAHCDLWMPRHPHLAHDDHVERRAQPFRDDCGHGNATAGQAQHNGIVEVGERVGERPPGVEAVTVHRRASPFNGATHRRGREARACGQPTISLWSRTL